MTAPDHGAYYHAIESEDAHLQCVMNEIRADEAAGNLTVREAADTRIAARETHLENCQAARRRHLGGDASGP